MPAKNRPRKDSVPRVRRLGDPRRALRVFVDSQIRRVSALVWRCNGVGNRKAVLHAREVAQPEHYPGGRCNGGCHQPDNCLGVIPSPV